MNLEDMILISVDDHVVEPPSMGDFFRENLPAKFRDRAPKAIRRADGTDAWLIEGEEVATFGLNAVQGRPPENWGSDPGSFDEVRPGCYDIDARIDDMNVNGILASLNFPSWPGMGGQYFMQNTDRDYVAAMTRTYNDWHLQEWCAKAPGRFNVFDYNGATLIADYGHNPDAIKALVAAVETMPARRRSVVISGAGDRRDIDIRHQTELLGEAFDDVVLYEDQCQRGRVDGEVLALLREGLQNAGRTSNTKEIRGEFLAIDTALQELQKGDLCLILVDQVEPALAHIAQRIAEQKAA